MALVNCQICLTITPVDRFRILTCGHGFCKECIDSLPAAHNRITCPNCRQRIHKDQLSRGIFLEFVDPKVATTSKVMDGLAMMNDQTPLASIRKTADKLNNAATLSRGDGELTTQLLNSIEDFKARIAPLFETVQSKDQIISSLHIEVSRHKSDRRKLEERLERAGPLHQKLAQLRKDLQRAQEIAEETTVAGEKMKNQMLELQNDLASYKKIASDLDQEKRRMADQLERNANATRAAREKCKAMKAENAELQRQLHLADQRHHNTREEPISPVIQPQDYDGDFSSHEMPMTSARKCSPRRSQIFDENAPDFDWEGMPQPSFGSDWQLNAGNRPGPMYGVLRKTRPSGGHPTHRRVTNPTLKLDAKGRPTTAIQLGPRRPVRI